MTPAPDVTGYFDQDTNTISYIVADPQSGTAAIIDPVLGFSQRDGRTSTAAADRLLAEIDARGLHLAWILETHAHADHLTAAHHIHERTGAPIVIGRHIGDVQRIFAPLFAASDVVPDGSAFSRLVDEGDSLSLGELTIGVMHTPGHTPACVTYRIGDAAFVGDTLFQPDYGTARADFPGGDAATLYRSIRKIFALPAETRIFTCHDYPTGDRSEPEWESTVAKQRAANIHVHDGVSEADFVAMRSARDKGLAAPQLVLPALQVNIRAGELPPPDPDGRRYLRIPLDTI
ncbi:MBL fold metallo-hydrolase [Sphingopyxis sp. EG6]|uniref:MBL fold metallo-hydrolase n=1 Tax=Sphingopyxis sp. EG6 TaxID=1874061 RepID=UPI000DC613E1|nr:MBL fold metallo-hydrolase [Sphingopyxis sp. EG6]BBB09257.1 beta-lactamase-like protein [Sphingopyxis sp. EG6]